MKNNKISIVLIGVLLIAISYIICDKVYLEPKMLKIDNDNLEKCNNKSSNAYQYSDIKGLYHYTTNTFTDESGNEVAITYNLYLYENGTFNYQTNNNIKTGIIGNYIIENNKIILNYLFETGSGVGYTYLGGTKTLIINNNYTILDNEESVTELDLSSIALEKAKIEEEKEFLQTNDLKNILSIQH